MPRPPTLQASTARPWICWLAQRCSVWSSRTNGASDCGFPIVSCGPTLRSCSAPGPLIPRGSCDHLRPLGIPVAIDLPDVGRHLEDHLLVAGVGYKARREVPRSRYNHADALLYVPQGASDASPELLVMCVSLPFVLPTVGPLASPAYALVPCLMRPRR